MNGLDDPSAGRFEGREHLLPVRIYYEDTDFSGVVYHGNYLRYFERGRSDFLRCAGVSHASLLEGDPPAAFSVVSMTLAFKSAARIDDALLARTRIASVAGARLHFQQRLTRGAALIASADVEACCISLTGRAIRPPRAVLEGLKPFLEGP